MKLTNNRFSIDLLSGDYNHCLFYYDELIKIIEVIRANEEEGFLLRNFKPMIPAIRKWDDLAIEQNLFLLKKLNVIDFELLDQTANLFKFRVIRDNLTEFKKIGNNRFTPDFKFSEAEYYSLLCDVEDEVFENEYQTSVDKFSDEISSRFTKNEIVDKLIAARDDRNNLYEGDTNALLEYKVENKPKLAAWLYNMNESPFFTLPVHPNASIFMETPLSKLKIGLYGRFLQLLRIKVLNELIEKETQPAAASETKKTEPLLFDNQFNGIDDYGEIRNHFIELTTTKSSIDNEPFLTDQQLDTFLVAAFVEEKIKEKIKVNYNASTQTRIIRGIFYKFYNYCITSNIEPAKGRKGEYVKLISDYFEGFEYQKVFDNWNK
jgi:hypothetical protein